MRCGNCGKPVCLDHYSYYEKRCCICQEDRFWKRRSQKILDGADYMELDDQEYVEGYYESE